MVRVALRELTKDGKHVVAVEVALQKAENNSPGSYRTFAAGKVMFAGGFSSLVKASSNTIQITCD